MKKELFDPLKIGYTTLRNRTIRSAAFESMGKDYAPTEQLAKYHIDVAKGGIGMTTLAYASVSRSGLSFNKQLWLRPEIVKPLHEITDAIHEQGAAASIQIGHCGNMTHIKTAGQIPIGASTGFNLYSPTIVRGMNKKEIMDTAKAFGTAIHTAADAGFDAVEVHAGHGYLISQFLSPYTNHRHDEYGGSLENRMRFMKMCFNEAMEASEQRKITVIAKHNMYDGFKSGIQIPESIEVAKQLEQTGIHAMVLTAGFVSRAPMAVMRGQIPIYTMSHYMSPWWLKYMVRWFGGIMIQSDPFTECYFLEDAKKFRSELNLPLIYVGGIVSRQGIESVLDAGFDGVQIARALVNNTAFVNQLKAGDINTRSECDHANYCIARMYSVDMQCHQHCGQLHPKIIKELEKNKKK